MSSVVSDYASTYCDRGNAEPCSKREKDLQEIHFTLSHFSLKNNSSQTKGKPKQIYHWAGLQSTAGEFQNHHRNVKSYYWQREGRPSTLLSRATSFNTLFLLGLSTLLQWFLSRKPVFQGKKKSNCQLVFTSKATSLAVQSIYLFIPNRIGYREMI